MKKRNQGQIAANTKVGWRINEWAGDVGICRASVYNLMTRGRLRSVKWARRGSSLRHPPSMSKASPKRTRDGRADFEHAIANAGDRRV